MLLVVLLAAPSIFAASAVELGAGISLSDEDLGLNGVVIDGDGETALVFGTEGYVRALDAQDPTQQIDLVWPGNEEILYADFHPGDQTALLVGTDGLVLRYAKQDQSLERAAAAVNLEYADMTTVAWNTGGSWAYVGTAEGQLLRLRADADGGAEIHSLAGGGSSPIMAMDCHDTIMMCVVAAAMEGIGIIERDHTFTSVAGTGHPWTGIHCPTGASAYCHAVAVSPAIALIELNPSDLSRSIPSVSRLPDVDSYFVGIEAPHRDRTLIATTPASLIEHDISPNSSYPWLEHDAINALNLPSDRLAGTRYTGAGPGRLCTPPGDLTPFSGPDAGSTGLLYIWIAIAIPVATGLVVLSLVLSSSKRMQDWTTEKSGSSDEKRHLANRKARQHRKRK